MAIATETDLSIVLSGGSTNVNPNLSIGGNPTAIPILDDSLNNLFSDVTPEQASEGREDYRCLYLFNDATGDNSTIYNMILWTKDQLTGGSTIEVGIIDQNESQRILLASQDGVTPINGGSFDIVYMGQTVTTNYNSDLTVWATNIQEQLLDLQNEDGVNLIDGVTVTPLIAGSASFVFDLTFTGLDAKRNVDLFEIANNNITPPTDITVSTLQEGSPVNTIAPLLDIDTTPPSNVVFFDPTLDEPILIPKLNSGDGFPIWFKRTTPAESAAVPADFITLGIRSTVLP